MNIQTPVPPLILPYLQKIEDWNVRETIKELLLIIEILSRRNQSQDIIDYTFTLPMTEYAIPHNLGRIPEGFHVIKRDNQGLVYSTATAWTSSIIYLQADYDGLVTTLLVF